MVLAAKGGETANARAALAAVCERYWPPIYTFIRRRGFTAQDAQDLTQEFFARLIEKNYLKAADAAKGRFRTLLLTAVTRFLVNDWERAKAEKRGGNCIHLSLEDCLAQEGAWPEPAERSTPETLYQRSWAETMLKNVLGRLRVELEKSGHPRRFDLLKPFLSGDRDTPSIAEIAAQLSVAEPTVYSLVHRMRQRYGELLRDEIGQTVSSRQEIADELRHLLAALSN